MLIQSKIALFLLFYKLISSSRKNIMYSYRPFFSRSNIEDSSGPEMQDKDAKKGLDPRYLRPAPEDHSNKNVPKGNSINFTSN